MTILVVIYLLVFVIVALAFYAVMQLKLAGIKVKDFWSFIEANQILYLKEAEKVFNAFEKIPDELWEQEYVKYKEVLDKYKDIRMIRWTNN